MTEISVATKPVVNIGVMIPNTSLAGQCPSADDLLLTFNFCDVNEFNKLTATQQACLSTQLCGTPAPANVQVNGVAVTTVASGGTHNQLVQDDAGSSVGTSANPSVVADSVVNNDAGSPTYTQNIQPEQTFSLPQGKMLDSDGTTTVLANYIPNTSGNMFTATPAITLSLGVSDATPTVGDTLTLTATPTNITPTSYMYFVATGTDILYLATQASNVYNWTVSLPGSITPHVIADDGTDSAVGCQDITVTGITFDKSTEFDGVNEYVSVPSDASLEFGTGARSYSIWVKTDTISGNHGIIDNLDAGSPYDGFMLLQLGANLQVYASGGSALINNSGYFTGEVGSWVHITVTRSAAGTWKLYKNGSYVTQATDTDDTDTGLAYVFGKRGSWYWDGKMALAVITDSEMSAAEITELYNSGSLIDVRLLSFYSDVVSWWPAGSGDTSPTWTDVKASNDGTMTNMDASNFVSDVP
jgi:hypothetical protein